MQHNNSIIKVISITHSKDHHQVSIKDFDELINLYQLYIYKLIFYRVRSEDIADELTQETFVQAYNSFKSLKRFSSAKSWLIRIALNKVNDFGRKQKLLSIFKPITFELEQNQSLTEDPLSALIKKEFYDKVKDFLEELPRFEREIFQLRYFDDLTVKEIKEVLNKNQNTIKTHLYRALKKYQQNLTFREFLNEV